MSPRERWREVWRAWRQCHTPAQFANLKGHFDRDLINGARLASFGRMMEELREAGFVRGHRLAGPAGRLP